MKRIAIGVVVAVLAVPSMALAQKAVIDNAVKKPRSEDAAQSGADVVTKQQQQGAKKGTVCNFTQVGGQPAKANPKVGDASPSAGPGSLGQLPAKLTGNSLVSNILGGTIGSVGGNQDGLAKALAATSSLLSGNASAAGSDALFIAAWGSNAAARLQGSALSNQVIMSQNDLVRLLNTRAQQDLAQSSGASSFVTYDANTNNPFKPGATTCDTACQKERDRVRAANEAAIVAWKKSLEIPAPVAEAPGPDMSRDSN